MFGLEILDVVIGLTFVYLLLALFATALNEYVAAVLNLRGRELAKGLGQLLDDLDEKGAVQRAFDGVGTKLTKQEDLLTERLYNHRLIRPLATRQGWIARDWPRFWRRSREPRLPSYIPARTFAQALLDELGVREKEAGLDAVIPRPATPGKAVVDAEQALATARAAAAGAAAADKPAAEKAVATARLVLTNATLTDAIRSARAELQAALEAQAARGAPGTTAHAVAEARKKLVRAELAQVLAILKQESSLDLTEHLATLDGLSTAGNKLAADLQLQLAGVLAGAQTQLQKLHDGVEVWFNNAMDRVSGAYKRTAQGWLFVLGLLIASCMNADTIDMWRRLEADDELRSAMVRRAETTLAAFDTLSPDTSAADTSAAPRSAQGTAPASAQASPQETDSPSVTLQSGSTGLVGDTTGRDSAKLETVKQAREKYRFARARLDSMELKLGWTTAQGVEARLLRKNAEGDTASVPWKHPIRKLERAFTPRGYHADLFPFDTAPTWVKLIGLLLTALAISLGAPFWFDLLNKVISIRAAGRSPEEKPKSPEGGPKRIAERAPK